MSSNLTIIQYELIVYLEHNNAMTLYDWQKMLHFRFKTKVHRDFFHAVVSHIRRIGCPPEKTTLQVHGSQSRSWSPEQGGGEEEKQV